MFSETPATPGRRQQMPRTFRSTRTPAREALYSARMQWPSTSAFIFIAIRPGESGEWAAIVALDLGDQPLAQMRRGDQNLAVAQRASVAGEVVEHVRDVSTDVLVDREQAEVGVQAGGGRVVVAGADVHVVTYAVALSAHDQDALGVGLQGRLSVDDVHARLLQRLGPVDVHALVKARRQLDERDRLLATLGRRDQIAGTSGESSLVLYTVCLIASTFGSATACSTKRSTEVANES